MLHGMTLSGARLQMTRNNSMHFRHYSDLTNPDKLQKDQRKYKKIVWKSHERVRAYLQHPDLINWLRRIEERQGRVRSFFDLLNKKEASVAKRLEGADLGFGYGIYQRRSMLIHGSTFDQFLLSAGDKIYPRFMSSGENARWLARHIGSTCRSILVVLATIKADIWPKNLNDD